jgi:hypothetical protein
MDVATMSPNTASVPWHLLRSSRFQVSQAPYDEILRFLIVEER